MATDIEEVAQLLEGVGFETVGFVDDDPLGQVRDVDIQVGAVAFRVQGPVDVGAQGVGVQIDFQVESPARECTSGVDFNVRLAIREFGRTVSRL